MGVLKKLDAKPAIWKEIFSLLRLAEFLSATLKYFCRSAIHQAADEETSENFLPGVNWRFAPSSSSERDTSGQLQGSSECGRSGPCPQWVDGETGGKLRFSLLERNG